MYYRDPESVLKCGGGGGQDSTGAIPRRQAGFYLVNFYYPMKKWGGHGPPPLFRGPCIFAISGEHSQHGINCVCA